MPSAPDSDALSVDALAEVMRHAPSTRHFREDPVPRELIHRALDNARYAPSGGNRQGWRVIVIEDAATRRRLRELYEEPWRAYMHGTGGRAALDDPTIREQLPAGRLRGLMGADEYSRTFDRAPVHIIPLVLLDALAIVDKDLDRPSIIGGASIYPFVQNLLLGLRAEGLGAAFTTLLAAVEGEVRELLGFPEDVAMAGHISLGFRADAWPKQLSRNPVEEFAFAERWDAPW